MYASRSEDDLGGRIRIVKRNLVLPYSLIWRIGDIQICFPERFGMLQKCRESLGAVGVAVVVFQINDDWACSRIDRRYVGIGSSRP